MKYRYIFRDPDGHEVPVPTAGDLTRRVQEGAITSETPLLDAITGEWRPAGEHTVFRLIREEMDAPEADTPADGGLGDVLLAPEEESGAEAVREFLEARERERREEGLRTAGDEVPVPLVDAGQDTVAHHPIPGWELPAEPRRNPTPPPESPVSRVEPAGAPAVRPPGRRPPRRVPAARPAMAGRPARPAEAASPPAAHPRPGGVRGILVVALAAAVTWGVLEWREGARVPVPEPPESLDIQPPPRPAGPLAAAVGHLSPGTFREMDEGADEMRRRMRVGNPPAVWMAAEYVADAELYPEVEGYWRRYRTFVDSLRAGEEVIFRSGLLGRLEEAGVQGRVLSVRLARSLQDFRADSLGRAEGYAAMEELADAALAFHAFLEEHAASLRFAAAAAGDGAGIRRGADMDDVVREGLRDGVQRVLAALEALAGPDPRRRAEVMQEIDVFLDGAPPPG